jgi:hypothetical protein
MSIAFVKEVFAGVAVGNGGTIIVPAGGVAQGDTLILTALSDKFSSITDSRGNTYTVDSAGGANDGAHFLSVAHAYMTTALQAGDTITVNTGFGGTLQAFAYEFSGIASSSALDKITNKNNGSGTTVTGNTTATLSGSTDLYFVACVVSINTTLTDSSPSGLTPLTDYNGAGVMQRARWKILSANAALGYSGTLGSAQSTGVIVATFQSSGGTTNNVTLNATQSQSPILSRQAAKVRALTQATVISLAAVKTILKSASVASAAVVRRAASPVRTATQASSATLRRAMAATRTATAFLSTGGLVQVGMQVVAGQGSWDNNPTTIAYQWQQCGVSDPSSPSWSAISGEINPDLIIGSGLLGQYLRCREIATNIAGDSQTAYTAVIGPVAAAGGSGPVLLHTLLRSFAVTKTLTPQFTHALVRVFTGTATTTPSLRRTTGSIHAQQQPTIPVRIAAATRTVSTDPVGQFARLLPGQQQERFLTATLTLTATLAHHLRAVFRGSLPGRIVGAFRGFVR